MNLTKPARRSKQMRNSKRSPRHAQAVSPALSDDSGLCVNALGGEPGIFSARWAGPDKDFRVAMEKVEAELKARGAADRAAHFTCALTLAWPDGHVETFEGYAHGSLVWPPRGEKGFGYDPVFMPQGYDITFGEMGRTRETRHEPPGRGLPPIDKREFQFPTEQSSGALGHEDPGPRARLWSLRALAFLRCQMPIL